MPLTADLTPLATPSGPATRAERKPAPPARRASKAPRRTAERILDAALLMFNRFGEPNVSTTAIASELGISPGNLHYHYPSKNGLIDTLFDRYDRSLTSLLGAADGVADVEDAWFFFHSLFELIWDYRFLYRDLNDLLSNNRKLEVAFQRLLQHKTAAVQQVLRGVTRHDPAMTPRATENLAGPAPNAAMHAATNAATSAAPDATAHAAAIDERDLAPVATSMVVVLTYWTSFEYVRDPRHALEPESAGAAMMRGAFHVLTLLLPYLEPEQRAHLHVLAGHYAG